MTGHVLAALAAGRTVITANNRQARSLRFAYDRWHAAAGHEVWRSGAIVPWDPWLRSLWDAAVLTTEPPSRLRLLTGSQARILWQELLPVNDVMADGAAAVAAARRAATAWNTCQSWGVDEQALRREADSRDSAIFVEWLSAFRHRCGAQGWVDPGSLPGRLTALLRDAGLRLPPTAFAFAGFERFDPAQQQLLDALADAGHGITRISPAPTPSTDIFAIPCATTEEELNRAAGWARRHKERNPFARIAVVVPELNSRSDDVRRAFLDVLAPDWRQVPPADSPVNVSYGMTLGRSGAVHAALLALGLLRGPVDYREAGQILRSRFLGDIEKDGAARAAADLALRERIGGQVDGADIAAAMGEGGAELAGAVRTAMARVQGPFERQRPGAWARIFSVVLTDLGWPGRAPIDSDLHQVQEGWQSALDGFASSDGLVGELTCGAALRHLRHVCDETLFQPAGLPHAIEVLGLLEALGRDFDALWIAGVTAARWPPAARPDPLLPLGLQRRLGIPGTTPASSRAEAWQRWQSLLASAPQVRVSWAACEADEIVTPSPFIAGIATVAAGAPELAGALGAVAAQQRSRPALIESPDPAPPASGPRLPGGTRLLALQSRCPARAFFEVRLGARETVTPPPGIVPEIRGKLLHAVLEGFFREVRSSAELQAIRPDECHRLIGRLLDTELARLAGVRDAFGAALLATERELLTGRIAAHIEEERAREPWEIVSLEGEREMELAGFRVRVRPDRVDRLGSGSLLVIDYKTGRFSPAGWYGLRPKEPQLPLYADLLDAGAIAAVCIRREGVRWYAAAAPGTGLPGSPTPKDKKVDWPTLRAGWHDAIVRLAAEIRRGDCRINRWDRNLAEGEWALVTRVYEAVIDDADDDEEPA